MDRLVGHEVPEHPFDVDAGSFEFASLPHPVGPRDVVVGQRSVAALDVGGDRRLAGLGERRPEHGAVELPGEIPQTGPLGTLAEPLGLQTLTPPFQIVLLDDALDFRPSSSVAHL